MRRRDVTVLAIVLSILPVAFIPSANRSAFAQGDEGVDGRTYYRATLGAAEKSIRLNEIRDARLWLDRAPHSQRGWEWNYLDALADESLATVDTEHPVTAMAVDPLGQFFIAADSHGTIRRMRIADLSETGQIGDHQQAVYSVDISADGKRLATVCRDATARVWNLDDGLEVARIELDNPGVAACAFSPDGTKVATCTWMRTEIDGSQQVVGTVWIWDATNGSVIAKKHVGVKPLDSIVWAADGTKIVVGSWDGVVHLLDDQAEPLDQFQVPDLGAYNAVVAVAINEQGTMVACGSKDRTARVWQLQSGELLATMRGHGGFVNQVVFDRDGSTLLTGGGDGTLRSWDIATGQPAAVLRGHLAAVSDFAIDRQTGRIISAASDHSIRLWGPRSELGGGLQVQLPHAGTYSTVYSADGESLYLACYDGFVRRFNTRTGQVDDAFDAHAGQSCNTLALSRDGTKLLTCSWDATAKLWDTSGNRLVRTLEAGDGVYDCAIAGDASLAALAVGSRIELWDLETGKQKFVCEGLTGGARETIFSPDGQYVAAASGSEPAHVWRCSDGELMARLTADGDAGSTTWDNASTVAFSSDGTSIATGTTGRVSIWDASSMELMNRIEIGDRPISQLAFSADNQRLAVGSDSVTIIDPHDSELLLQFQPNVDEIYFLAFSPDGKTLATCTTGGGVSLSQSTPVAKRDNPAVKPNP
jgi:WD40 repeat protein